MRPCTLKVALALEGLRDPPEIAVCIYNIFDNNFGIKNDLTKYLMVTCWLHPCISPNLLLLERFQQKCKGAVGLCEY